MELRFQFFCFGFHQQSYFQISKHNIFNLNCITFVITNRMSSRFGTIPETPKDSDHDSDGSDQSQDYYEYERRKMEAALERLKKKENLGFIEQLKKNTAQELKQLDKYQQEVADLHKLTRNNEKNILEQSIIKEIKSKVFNQSMIHTIRLADQQLQKKKIKDQVIQKQSSQVKAKNQFFKNLQDQAENKINQKLQAAKREREIIAMTQQDQYSMKVQQHYLSIFFQERYFTPNFHIPPNKVTSIVIQNLAPKSTFTQLRALPNTEANILPQNAPQLALRRLGRSKKISLKPSSISQISIKVKKLNPQCTNNKKRVEEKIAQQDQLQLNLDSYLKQIQGNLSTIQSASQKYKPRFVPQFRGQSQKNVNIDKINESQDKSLCQAIQIEKSIHIKDLKLTFQQITNLKGIEKLQNIQHAALQFNCIINLNGIQKCTKLIQVNLSHNKIKSVDSIKEMKWLRMLNIQYNLIDKIQLTGGSLQILYASNNRIQNIVDLSSNTYLKRLIVDNNNLHQLEGLRKLHYLQEIDAHKNYLESLKGIQQCILLRILNLSRNRLTEIYPNFTFIFLNKIYLSYNSLQKFPNMFLPSLEQLYLDHNRISTQSTSNLYFPNLKVLNMDDNRISGFCTVWSFLRFSRNLTTLKYNKNEYFMNLRQKVKQLYEHIIYKSMNKLTILNQDNFDKGIKKYYQGVYQSYLSQKQIFKKENKLLQLIHNKIRFTIKSNQCISGLEDKRSKFCETDLFVRHKSVTKAQDLISIITFLQHKNEDKILHLPKSILYQHDKFQYKMRDSLQKIQNLIIRKQYRKRLRRNYFEKNKPKLQLLISYLQKYIVTQKIIEAVKIFHLPLQGMSKQKAAIVIQKNWRCYRMRKRYLKLIKKMRKQKEDDSDLEDIDLDDYDFDNMEIPEFNFELPEELDFDQFIIRPQIFQMIDNQESRRIQEIRSNNSNLQARQAGSQRGHMVNNFVQNNQSHFSQHEGQLSRQQKKEQDIQKIMKQWGVNREAAMALLAKNELKEERKRKEAEKNMTAAQRYQKFKKR